MGNTSNFNSFLIGDSQNSFYSISMDNHIYKFDVNSQKVMSDRSLPLNVSIRNFRTSPRDNQSNWFITYAGDGSMTANILDTAATIIASTGINIIKNDFNGFEIDTTPDNGFVVVTNAGTYENTDRYHVYRYSDKATQLWQKELINFGIIRTVVSLKEGGFLIGGSKFTREDFTRSSYLTKLDDEGNVLWTKIKHIGHLNNEYFINEIVEDTSLW